MKVAIQGQAGSFHAEVAYSWYGKNCELVPCASFAEVFEVYERGEADAMIVAVENTVYGSINEVYRLVEDANVPIVGEVKLPVHQQLIANPGAKLSDITEIYSHPIALAQCRDKLTELCPEALLIEYFDTAGAVEHVASLKSNHAAAVASRSAAELHNLSIIASDVHDSQANITRFLVLQDRPAPSDANRASLVLTTNHQPGALLEVLQVFADANINLAKLQSQPIIGQPWQYKFFVVVDCAGKTLHQVIDTIRSSDHDVKLLGEYKAST